VNFLIKQFAGLIYFGCCGIKEIRDKEIKKSPSYDPGLSKLLTEFAFKYGLFLYLREELAFLRNKSTEYYVNID
jgi:hypothetical protein